MKKYSISSLLIKPLGEENTGSISLVRIRLLLSVRHLFSPQIPHGTCQRFSQSRGFIKVFNRRATEFDTRAKNWQGPEGLAL